MRWAQLSPRRASRGGRRPRGGTSAGASSSRVAAPPTPHGIDVTVLERVHQVTRGGFEASVRSEEEIAGAAAPFASEAHVTAFASAALVVGALTLDAQRAVHSASDSPLGGTTGVRLTP